MQLLQLIRFVTLLRHYKLVIKFCQMSIALAIYRRSYMHAHVTDLHAVKEHICVNEYAEKEQTFEVTLILFFNNLALCDFIRICRSFYIKVCYKKSYNLRCSKSYLYRHYLVDIPKMLRLHFHNNVH